MVIELCSCDCGIGLTVSHEHMTLSLITRDGADRPAMWMRNFILQRGWTVLAEVEEILPSVDWKAIVRDLWEPVPA